ncbi:hypothetical protein M404DRAFT_108240, partial [Pisolithus tinctorius Marx 270]
QAHETGGHWGQDALKIALTDRYYALKMDLAVMKAIHDCAKCKNFGTPKLNSLLEPITRRHLFELLVGDYLAMPMGKGRYHTLGLFLDTFSQHLWVTKFKTAGTAKMTADSLANIFNSFTAVEMFMMDGGCHFNNKLLLLHVLKCLCTPNMGEDGAENDNWEKLLRMWPDHLDDAVWAMNNHLLLSLKFTPKELLLGLVIDTKHTELMSSTTEPSTLDATIHMAYATQQCLDSYNKAVRHAIKRKTAFDHCMLKRQLAEVVFNIGDLIQIYQNDLDYTFKTERKLLPKWSTPHRVAMRLRNSYRLETLAGTLLEGEFSARHLCTFKPREGTCL